MFKNALNIKAEKVAWGSLPPYTNWLMAVGSFFHEPPLSICHAMANKRNTSRDIARPFVVCICSQPPRGISLLLVFILRLPCLSNLEDILSILKLENLKKKIN